MPLSYQSQFTPAPPKSAPISAQPKRSPSNVPIGGIVPYNSQVPISSNYSNDGAVPLFKINRDNGIQGSQPYVSNVADVSINSAFVLSASGGDSNSHSSTPPPAPPGSDGGGNNGSKGRKTDSLNNKIDRHTISMNARYHDGLAEFKRRCTDYTSIMQFLTDAFNGNVGGIRNFVQSRPQLDASDIGCGDGTITEHLAGTMLSFRGDMHLEVIEPMEDYIAQTSVKLAVLLTSGLTIRFVKSSSEEHFSQTTVGRYDILFASHSLHLIPLNTLSNIAASVRKGGYFVIVIGAQNSIMSTLKDLFAPKPAITGTDILRYMEDISSEHPFEVTVISQPSDLDLRDIDLPERKDHLTETANNILSLMIQKNIDEVDQVGYAKVRQLINEKIKDGKLRLDNDCIIFKML